MIIKILGLLDIFVGIVFWLFGIFHIIPDSFVLILGLFLLAKGVIFVFGLIVSFLNFVPNEPFYYYILPYFTNIVCN